MQIIKTDSYIKKAQVTGPPSNFPPEHSMPSSVVEILLSGGSMVRADYMIVYKPPYRSKFDGSHIDAKLLRVEDVTVMGESGEIEINTLSPEDQKIIEQYIYQDADDSVEEMFEPVSPEDYVG